MSRALGGALIIAMAMAVALQAVWASPSSIRPIAGARLGAIIGAQSCQQRRLNFVTVCTGNELTCEETECVNCRDGCATLVQQAVLGLGSLGLGYTATVNCGNLPGGLFSFYTVRDCDENCNCPAPTPASLLYPCNSLNATVWKTCTSS